MNICPRCGKVTQVDSLHTCKPPEVCEAEKKLNDLLESDREIVSGIIKKLRKPIQGLSDR